MLNTRTTALPSSSSASLLPPPGTPSEAGPSRTATALPSGVTEGLQARQSAAGGTAPRAPLPAATPAGVAGAAATPPAAPQNLWGRLADLKQNLTALRTLQTHGKEPAPKAVDGQFLDLLIATENARHPSLNLSQQSIDIAAVRSGPAEALKAVSGLADALVKGIKHGQDWRAVLKIDDHHVAVEARHNPKHPTGVSLVVVDSLGSDIKNTEWLQIAQALREHANRALHSAGQAANAQVWINTLNTAMLRTASASGSDVFALATARKMPADGSLVALHKRVLTAQRSTESPTAVRVIDNHSVGDARLFKLTTSPQVMDELLNARPALQQAPVNKKGQTLADYQAAHLATRAPGFGLSHSYNTAYEDKRLHLYERTIAHIESKLAPQLDAMKAHLQDLQRTALGEGSRPAARDGQFMAMLMDAENAQNPSLRLSAHRLDAEQLRTGNPAATDSLWRAITDGMRTGQDWHATLEVQGHHVALAARHDTANPAHLSLVVMADAGAPFKAEDWKAVVGQLLPRMQAQAANSTDGADGKVWMTVLNLSSTQPAHDSAVFALMGAKGMAGDAEIAHIHAEALTQARNVAAPAALRGRPGDALLDPDLTAHHGNLLDTPDLMATQIEMYEQAVGHHELILAEHA
jgi:hypothetical protein